jgi:copper chaperone CopZ
MELKIDNMDCEACARGLEAQLKREPGIKNAKIKFSDAKGVIEYDPHKTSADKIVLFLTNEEFPSKVIADEIKE